METQGTLASFQPQPLPGLLDATICRVTEHGYKPVFFHEELLDGPKQKDCELR